MVISFAHHFVPLWGYAFLIIPLSVVRLWLSDELHFIINSVCLVSGKADKIVEVEKLDLKHRRVTPRYPIKVPHT